jgi:Glycerophosphoryl diester phosphodiesterase family
VRENTILSFLKAATNHTDFIEFDVHVCKVGLLQFLQTAANTCCDGQFPPQHKHLLRFRMGRWLCTTTAR